MKLLRPFIDIFFPPVCICCGCSLKGMNRHICYWCGYDRFEYARGYDEELNPESVLFVWSMWEFDKGGYIQDLLHNLKYHHLRGVGTELGYIAGRTFLDRMSADTLQFLDARIPILVPVPLHASKRRKRGYNQTMALGEGLSASLMWDLSAEVDVERVRKTRTQTGLNTAQRAANLKGAFQIKNPEVFLNRIPIIVDDVYTTGATAHELASTLSGYDLKCGIITIARA
jgi:ComF family protein